MAKLLSDRTAGQLVDLLNNMGKNQTRRGNDPRDLGAVVESDYPWRLTYTTESIRVTIANWRRNGVTVSLAPDTDKTYKSITSPGNPASGSFAASTTYYVYAQLLRADATYDPRIFPDSVAVYADTSLPADNTPVTGNYILPLGTATTNSYGEIASVTQYWRGGDVDDISWVPDSSSSYPGLYKSLEFCPEVSGLRQRHYFTGQIYGWDTAASEEPDGDSLFVYQASTAADKPAKYASLEDIVSAITSGETPLLNHDDTGGAADSTVHDTHMDGRYWRLGGSYNDTNNTGCYGQSIGRGTGNGDLAIDLDLSKLHRSAVNSNAASLDWDNNQLLLDWTAEATTPASASGAAFYSKGGIKADVGGYFTKGAADQAVYGVSGSYIGKLGTASAAGHFTDGTYIATIAEGGSSGALYATNGAGEAVVLTGGDYAAELAGNGDTVRICGTTGAVDVVTGDYYHAGNQGSGTGQEVTIPLASGGYLTCYLRGGILCVS